MKNWRALKVMGCTEFEVNSNKEATNFLYTGMTNILMSKADIQQTEYLLDNDIMSDEEWLLYLELRWRTTDIN